MDDDARGIYSQTQEEIEYLRGLSEGERAQLVVNNGFTGLDEKVVQEVKDRVKLKGHL